MLGVAVVLVLVGGVAVLGMASPDALAWALLVGMGAGVLLVFGHAFAPLVGSGDGDPETTPEGRPCGNPQCRAPLPRGSRRLYCSRPCRTYAERAAREMEADAYLEEIGAGEGDPIPF